MIDKLRGWAQRFKWVTFSLGGLLGAIIGRFLAAGTSQSLQDHLRFIFFWALGWATVLGICWLLSQWFEFED